ncbi:MFS transporter [Streptomyces sp. NA02950]|uniref:MFS transporter n=1 Tax=Streptomyces sp. NA02950 TaxID=2742137 RepID=UPI00159188A7|nr:MFS transporter [Streptomyces sp. NA02950]QKV96793.1 MFS transporter [Streptomyces sp. NA02950]
MAEEGGPAARRRSLVAVSSGVFCVQLDAFALNPALPGIARDLGVTGAGLSWVVSGYLLAAGALMLGAGRLGDLLGRRALLTAGLVVFAVASLGCALAPSLPVLVIARVVQGAGGALTMPVGLALLTNAYPPASRGRALGWALGAGGTATACGPFLGGVLTEALSWRAVFWVNVPVALVAAVWAARAADSRDSAAPPTVDGKGLVTVTAAVAGLALLVDRGPVWGWLSGPTAVTLALVVVVLVVFVRCERVAANPLVGLGLFRNERFVALTAAGAVANAATVVFLFMVPLALQGPWGLSSAVAGSVFLAPATAMALAGPVAGRIPRAGTVRAMAWCLGLGAAGLGAVSRVPTLPGRISAATVCGAALGVANALTLIATQTAVAPERAGEASGVTKTVITVAAGLGVALCGPVAGPYGAPVSARALGGALTDAGLCCLAGALLLGLRSRRRLPGLPSRRRRTRTGD